MGRSNTVDEQSRGFAGGNEFAWKEQFKTRRSINNRTIFLCPRTIQADYVSDFDVPSRRLVACSWEYVVLVVGRICFGGCLGQTTVSSCISRCGSDGLPLQCFDETGKHHPFSRRIGRYCGLDGCVPDPVSPDADQNDVVFRLGRVFFLSVLDAGVLAFSVLGARRNQFRYGSKRWRRTLGACWRIPIWRGCGCRAALFWPRAQNGSGD